MSTTTRWRIAPAAWPIIAAAMLAESLSNALKAYGLGTHLAAFTVPLWGVEVSLAGAALVLAAVAMSMSQARCFWTFFDATSPKSVRGLALLIGGLCLVVSVTAIASHILEAQRIKTGAETQDSTAYTDAKALYDVAAADFERVKALPSVAEVEAAYDEAVKKAGIDANIWRRSNGCTDATTTASRRECEKMPSGFQAKLAAARRKAELQDKLPKLKSDMERHKLTGAATSQEDTAMWAWAWGLGVAIVIVATFGPVIFRTRVVAVSSPGKLPEIPAIPANDSGNSGNLPRNPTPPTPPRRGRREDPEIAQFSDEFRKRNGRAPAGSEVKAAFPELPVSTAYDYSMRARKKA